MHFTASLPPLTISKKNQLFFGKTHLNFKKDAIFIRFEESD